MTIQSHPALACSAPPFPETSYGIVKRLRAIDRWAELVGTWRGARVLSILDYGCGTGDHVTYPLARRGHRVLGVDYHAPSIEEAGRRLTLPNLSFRVADSDQLVREGAVFDLVICSEVLEHLYEPLSFLRQIRRMLEPNGGLIITTPNGYGAFEWLSWLERTLEPVGVNVVIRRIARVFKQRQADDGMANHSPRDASRSIGFLNMDSKHVQFFHMGELESLFARSGFDIVDRQARTMLCGPYIDQVFHVMPFQQALYDINNRMADVLPARLAADWMFLLRPKPKE